MLNVQNKNSSYFVESWPSQVPRQGGGTWRFGMACNVAGIFGCAELVVVVCFQRLYRLCTTQPSHSQCSLHLYNGCRGVDPQQHQGVRLRYPSERRPGSHWALSRCDDGQVLATIRSILAHFQVTAAILRKSGRLHIHVKFGSSDLVPCAFASLELIGPRLASLNHQLLSELSHPLVSESISMASKGA